MLTVIGSYVETAESEMQLHMIMENTTIVRKADGLPTIVLALTDAAWRYSKAM
jgi:hypothetical protein